MFTSQPSANFWLIILWGWSRIEFVYGPRWTGKKPTSWKIEPFMHLKTKIAVPHFQHCFSDFISFRLLSHSFFRTLRVSFSDRKSGKCIKWSWRTMRCLGRLRRWIKPKIDGFETQTGFTSNLWTHLDWVCIWSRKKLIEKIINYNIWR